MLICPNCAEPLPVPTALLCEGCGWRGEMRDGIPDYLTARDLEDPILRDYIRNYDQICEDDLKESIVDEHFLQNIATKTANAVRDPQGATICDVGSGKGYLARGLLARGASEVTCVDISLPYLRKLAGVPELRLVLANAENMPFAEEFDIVVAVDVIEHVLNVGSLLYAINRALKPGGRVYIRAPYRESLLPYSPHVGCRYRLVHLRSFDKALMRTYLREAGFAVERFRFDNFWLEKTWSFWMRPPFLKRGHERFQEAVRKRLAQPTDVTLWDSRIASIFMRPLEIFVVARKEKRIVRGPNGGFNLQ